MPRNFEDSIVVTEGMAWAGRRDTQFVGGVGCTVGPMVVGAGVVGGGVVVAGEVVGAWVVVAGVNARRAESSQVMGRVIHVEPEVGAGDVGLGVNPFIASASHVILPDAQVVAIDGSTEKNRVGATRCERREPRTIPTKSPWPSLRRPT